MAVLSLSTSAHVANENTPIASVITRWVRPNLIGIPDCLRAPTRVKMAREARNLSRALTLEQDLRGDDRAAWFLVDAWCAYHNTSPPMNRPSGSALMRDLSRPPRCLIACCRVL